MKGENRSTLENKKQSQCYLVHQKPPVD